MPPIDPSGKVCLVTGAGAGLGRAMAMGLAQAGAHVIAADVDEAAAKKTVADTQAAGKFYPHRLDVTDRVQCEDAIAQTVKSFGRIDVLVNCAGLNMLIFSKDFLTDLVRFWTVDPDKWQKLYDVNVRGPFLLARAAAPHMMAQKWGRIINVTTSYSTMMRAGNTPYGQAKAAMEAGTVCWADDLAGTGVTCNVLIPGGAADTAMIPADSPVDRSKLVKPEAMIGPLKFLASSASDRITGQRFVARDWNDAVSIEDNLQSSMSPAAWPELAAGASPGAPVNPAPVRDRS